MTGLLLVSWLMQSPAAPPAVATARGRVVTSDGRPVARAQVRLRPSKTAGAVFREALTDETGRYELRQLPPGEYAVTARKTGFVDRDETISLKAGEINDRLDFVLARHGAVMGRVLDENGEPVDGVSISVLQMRFVDGRRQLLPAPSAASRRANELGNYRLWGLPPGEYFVSATVLGSDAPGYAITYFPGTTNPADAGPVRVGAGEDVAADFSLAPVATARISGTTIASTGEPFQGGIRMRASRRSGIATDTFGARTYGDGRFEFPNVPPGEYVIEAFKDRELGWRSVTVNGTDVQDVTIETMPGSIVRGQLRFDGTAPIPPFASVALTAVPADPDRSAFNGNGRSAQSTGDRAVQLENVVGVCRLVVSGVPTGWMLRSILAGDTDVTDAALSFGLPSQSIEVEIVLTDQTTGIAGTVHDSHGGVPADALVVAFPADANRRASPSRFLRSTRTDHDGGFTIDNMPPGDYEIAAIAPMADADPDAWQDPELLDRFALDATRVILLEGQHVLVTLKRD